MSSTKLRKFNRRRFLQAAGSAAVSSLPQAQAAALNVSIVLPAEDRTAVSGPVKWAAGELRAALASRQIRAAVHDSLTQAGAGDLCVVAAGWNAPVAREILAAAKASLPETSEAMALAAGKSGGRTVVAAAGSDARGTVYALLELADRIRYAPDAAAAFDIRKPVVEQPANAIRSIARCFETDVEDKSWFYDRDMWREYLTMLATHRFNRFSLTLGLGYNFPRNVRDVYFYFAYPYLVRVPGYNVRVSNLADPERERNLETLRFIGDETIARGLQFQLGLWTHAYQWIDSPNAQQTIEGLDQQTHAPYCRDALQAVLKACPAISGLTFRVHGESGVPEGNYEFWETLFQGIVKSGRKIEIDMHAKGMDQKMIDVAQATGMPVNLSPKYWAEHMGLAYHQAAIRDLEMPRERKIEGPFTLSSGSRSFLRYGWGDLLTEKRSYGVLHRIWPGTQRFLLWGDPALAAGYGRYSNFCGTQGVELCEPLSFKGRIGSGLPGGRCAYADHSLDPRYDWQKYLYTYRVWGRSIYNPDTDPEGWRRYLRHEMQPAARPAEAALANASRILPLVTTAHGASGSNNTYWPEIYTNMPIVDAARKHPYRDSPSPQRFGTVSPFDPQLFSSIDGFAAELLGDERSARYSPADVAHWLDELSASAARHLKEMRRQSAGRQGAGLRRMEDDVAIQAGIGRFFAEKMRAGVLWALFENSGDTSAREAALRCYRSARAAWAEMANAAKPVYAADITYGMTPQLRGHWLDRLPAIDDDIADMEKHTNPAATPKADPERARRAVRQVLAWKPVGQAACRHTPAAGFRAGEPLAIEVSVEKGGTRSAVLHYRHVNQAERWQKAEMQSKDDRYTASIPANYTRSPYALEYYFEVRDSAGVPGLYPGLQADLSNQPYFLVRQA